jgi:uncharacterized protein YndB with AHSA1/START domain
MLDLEIHHSVLISAAPERIYETLTTPEGWDGWFTCGARLDARPGGFISFRWVDWGPDRYTGESGGPVLEAVRPSRFVFQWSPDQPGYATTVAIQISPTPHGSRLDLVESGYHDTPSGRRALLECAVGWGEALTLLKVFLEHGLSYK